MLKIEYSKKAEFDLEDIADFIAKDSKNRALSYLSKMQELIELISQNPNLGIACSSKNIKLKCRILIFEAYLIFYKVIEKSVLIIRILHSSVNYKKILV